MKPNVIILEGPDGAGKTTVARALCKLTGYDETHLSAPVGETAYELCARHLAEVLETGRNTVFDRFHLSEPIYGPIHRGVSTMDPVDTVRLESVLWVETRAVVVLCLPPWMRTFENWRERHAAGGEMITNSEHFKNVYFEYCEVVRNTTLPVLHHDYTRHTVEDLLFRLRQLGVVL